MSWIAACHSNKTQRYRRWVIWVLDWMNRFENLIPGAGKRAFAAGDLAHGCQESKSPERRVENSSEG